MGYFQIIFLAIILIIIWSIYTYRKKRLKRKGIIAYRHIFNFLEDYELELLKDFNDYKKDFIVTEFNLEDNEFDYYKDNRFEDADILKSFSKITSIILKEERQKLKSDERDSNRIKLILDVFEENCKKEKLKLINKKIETTAIEIAAEYSYTEEEEIGSGCEFTAIRAMVFETYIGFHFSIENYGLLVWLLFKREANPKLNSKEYWSLVKNERPHFSTSIR